MKRIPITMPIRKVLFDIGEDSTPPGTGEKLQGSLLGDPKIQFLPFHREGAFIPPGVVNNVLARHSAYYMRW